MVQLTLRLAGLLQIHDELILTKTMNMKRLNIKYSDEYILKIIATWINLHFTLHPMGFSIRLCVASDFDSEPVPLLGFMGISFIEIKILCPEVKS